MAPDTPEAAPGLHVPNTAIPWALDNFEGTMELVPVHHAVTTSNKHTGKNVAGSIAGSVFYRPEITTELQGQHAKAQLHTSQPVFYLQLNADPEGDDNGDKHALVLVATPIVKSKRIVSRITFNSITGHGRHEEPEVPISLQDLPGGWIRVTVNRPLAPGEYALLDQPQRGEAYASVVYPFGLDDKAPESAEARRAAPEK